jgi:hypothetical protein
MASNLYFFMFDNLLWTFNLANMHNNIRHKLHGIELFSFTLVVIHLESFAEPFCTSYYSSLTICVYYKHTARFPFSHSPLLSMLFHFRTSRMQVLVDYSTSFYCRSLAPTVNETRYEHI